MYLIKTIKGDITKVTDVIVLWIILLKLMTS